MSTRRLALALTFGWVAGCSLLAPSDEEATSGVTDGPGLGEGGFDARVSNGDGNTTSDGQTCKSGLVACGDACCAACNDGVCAGCRLNGASCSDGDQCCSDTCSSSKTCGVTTGCAPFGDTCEESSKCCAGLSCATSLTDATSTKSCRVCGKVGLACKIGADCCSRVCSSGACSACLVLEANCDTDDTCCTGYCNKGHCRAR